MLRISRKRKPCRRMPAEPETKASILTESLKHKEIQI